MTEPWMWKAYPNLMMVGLLCWIVGTQAILAMPLAWALGKLDPERR